MRKSSKSNKSRHEDIVRANFCLLETLPNVDYEKVEAGDLDAEVRRLQRTCWGCGFETVDKGFTRAHVIARSDGGLDEPSNFFLLCDVCHREQPDGMPRSIQEEWLRKREDFFSRSMSLINGWLDEILAISVEVTRTDIQKWQEGVGVEKILSVIHEGYRSAAGWENGRVNARAAFVGSFREWWNRNHTQAA